MKRHLLDYLKSIGLLETVPESPPGPGTVLARGVCPLHDDADNANAFLLYADGFVCTTHQCHYELKLGVNLEGLIRCLVYRVTDEVMPWRAAWQFARENPDRLRELVQNRVRPGKGKRADRPEVDWTAADLASCLEIPDPFYLSRGYRPETLIRFGVGRCVRPLPDGRDLLLGWSVFPVMHRWGDRPVGYTARNPKWVKGGTAIKWFHGVSRQQLFYPPKPWPAGRKSLFLRDLFSKPWDAWMYERDPLFACEGPGCVMRFWEAGFHAVATLGAPLTERQGGELGGASSFHQLCIVGDNDEGGLTFVDSFRGRLLPEPIVMFPPPGLKDFGDAPASEIPRLLEEARKMHFYEWLRTPNKHPN